MGVWCAVYSPGVQEKAERGVEGSCTRRGTKKRGKGSTRRRKLERAMTRSARESVKNLELTLARGVSPEVVPLIRAAEKADRARRRIDKLHERGIGFGLKVLSRVAEAEHSLRVMRGRVSGVRRGDPVLTRSLEKQKRLEATISSLRKRAIDSLSGSWGLPKYATAKRVTLLRTPFFHAIPRVTLGAFAMAPGELGASARSALLRAYGKTCSPFPETPCRCKHCRTHVLCDNGHGVSAGFRTCGHCEWVRPRCLGPSVRRADGIGRSERKRLRFDEAPLRPR
jgi:hypothetical protein